ncbi:glutamate decarboxylase [Escherichia coli]|nr:glutamate decarboxylase [Escherichia coli]
MDQKLLTDFRSELLDSRFGAKAISTIAESKTISAARNAR